MKEILVLKGLLTELEKRIDVLYDKVDEKLDKENDNDHQRKNNADG